MQIPNIKQEAHRLVEQLPDNATWDDLAYEIYVRQAIEEGLSRVTATAYSTIKNSGDDWPTT